MKEKQPKTEEKTPENIKEELKNAINTQKEAIKHDESKSKDESKELIEQLQRIQAEFENYKKRTEKEKQDIFQLGKASVLLKALDIMDNFERAIESLKTMEKKEDVQKGIEMIFHQMHKFLEEEGIKSIKAEGNKFDPYMHEVMKVENSDNDNTVMKELQKGYMLNNKVIRTSKVVLSRKMEEK